MKAVILAGGAGIRLRSAATDSPKPLVTIGGQPILWHIMMICAAYGFKDFLILTGHRSTELAAYFADRDSGSDWAVEVLDTGVGTGTGGRLARARHRIGKAPFLLTYADGLADIDLAALMRFHTARARLATLTAVPEPPRFGRVQVADDLVRRFEEKTPDESVWINGGFFLLEPHALDGLERDEQSFERDHLPRLVGERQLAAYRHKGFWACMDTPADREQLENLWRSGRAPWKIWND